MSELRQHPVDLRTDIPHPARVYDYVLGGKDNFAADRVLAEQGLRINPQIRTTARENRAFMTRVVRHLAAEVGIRQFLDIGTGLPTAPNVHQVAQASAPDARVVYVDNDPIVLSHARALLASSPEGRTDYIDADVRDVGRILSSPRLRSTLDLDQPVALLLIALLHLIPDDDRPDRILAELLEALPSGSYLALTHLTADFSPDKMNRSAALLRQNGVDMNLRPYAQVDGFFAGLEPVEPGVVAAPRWRPDSDDPTAADADASIYAGLGRKP
ncbi:SAM-dependent methyltransferase [Micromonospora sp. WMMA1363]|uniref:SAM-dependent methyltransferase n=1 Tax=Micromonospora sp. WMMA1363 TaxID=3053985 RepID=UPI00259CBF8F|nr:SAM-dependent methyltransferase [Micromonospora sp. WMMA1363]MDM4719328.1 SAM-dependent methyltransferase [Micromonospora sp. WMMA1363]